MVSSMTGYGRAQSAAGGRDITVEVKSVNHRFFEFSPRVSRSFAYLEEKLKNLAYSKIQRGKVDLSVTVIQTEGTGAEVAVNGPLAASYLAAMRSLGESLGVPDDLTLSSLARFGELFTVRKTADDEDAVWDAVREVAREALSKLAAMRALEGEKLVADIIARLGLIDGYVARIEELAPGTVAVYREKLTAKITELLEQRQIDESRILTEAAVFAEKIAVDEETVRIKSHIAQFKAILGGGGAVGRKLDFLVQELNREANTIGSKAQDLEISRIVVEIKSEIEKIREQVQNIE